MPGIVSESIQNGISEILNKNENRWIINHPKFHILEKIPAKMLNNAVVSYIGNLDDDEAVILLEDTTIFGSAKDSVVITTKRICWKVAYFKYYYGHVLIKNILDVESKKVKEEYFEIFFNTNYGPVLFLPESFYYEKGFRHFIDFITFLKGHNSVASASTDTAITTGEATYSSICKGCGAPKTGSGPCEYCGSV